MTATAVGLWTGLLADVTAVDVARMREVCEAAELRRPSAEYATGTISLAGAVVLHALTRKLRPEVVAEVGTFIGTSTYAMVGERIYTCDKDNACVPSRGHIKAFRMPSAGMFSRLREHGIPVDFWFFDGRLQDDDVPMIRQLATPNAVFAFDDYSIGVRRAGVKDKGMLNVEKLVPFYPRHVLYAPPERVLNLDSTTTIAVLAPEGVL